MQTYYAPTSMELLRPPVSRSVNKGLKRRHRLITSISARPKQSNEGEKKSESGEGWEGRQRRLEAAKPVKREEDASTRGEKESALAFLTSFSNLLLGLASA